MKCLKQGKNICVQKIREYQKRNIRKYNKNNKRKCKKIIVYKWYLGHTKLMQKKINFKHNGNKKVFINIKIKVIPIEKKLKNNKQMFIKKYQKLKS